MQIPSETKPALWGAAGGIVAGMLVLSYGFGYMSNTNAQKIADAQTEKAVIAALTPVCAEKFRALPDVAARTAILVANSDNTYLMRPAFKDQEGLVTLPGKTYPESDLVGACAKLVLTPPKSAAVAK
jgi:alpha/beta superfamily hydrolase